MIRQDEAWYLSLQLLGNLIRGNQEMCQFNECFLFLLSKPTFLDMVLNGEFNLTVDGKRVKVYSAL